MLKRETSEFLDARMQDALSTMPYLQPWNGLEWTEEGRIAFLQNRMHLAYQTAHVMERDCE